MKLSDLLQDISYQPQTIPAVDVTDIVYDSRHARPSVLFVCLTGAITDGHLYAPSAYNLGCRIFLAQRPLPLPADALVILVDDCRLCLSLISAAFFGYPSRRLKVIGVTGTKGKTTVTYLIQNVLECAGIKTGVVGTNGIRFGDVHIKTANTTPESYELQKAFRRMLDAGCTCAVIEVSSQGLMTNRVNGIEFDTAVFTNISPDHIGPTEHPSFEHYLACKASLFAHCRFGLINIDDDHASDILAVATCETATFGLSALADYRAQNIKLFREGDFLGILFDCVSPEQSFKIKAGMPGTFSALNALVAAVIALRLGIDPVTIAGAISGAKITGRIESIDALPFCTVIVDYAHNAVSLRSLLTTLRDYEPRRLICLFGSVGGRTKLRRAEMGLIAAELADFSILTSDNPGLEDPMNIIRDIESAMDSSGGRYISIPDRVAAIKYAIDNAKPGDIVLLAGKGHETAQLIGDRLVPFNDGETARRFGKMRMARETNQLHDEADQFFQLDLSKAVSQGNEEKRYE